MGAVGPGRASKPGRTAMRHVMVDIETLGRTPDHRIASIGARWFDPRGSGLDGAAFEARLDVSRASGLVCIETMAWWMRQSAEVREEALGGQEDEREALGRLRDFLRLGTQEEPEGIWARGPDFDLVALTAAARRVSMELPMAFRTYRCVRTVLWAQQKNPAIRSGYQHAALNDVDNQIQDVQAAIGQP